MRPECTRKVWLEHAKSAMSLVAFGNEAACWIEKKLLPAFVLNHSYLLSLSLSLGRIYVIIRATRRDDEK